MTCFMMFVTFGIHASRLGEDDLISTQFVRTTEIKLYYIDVRCVRA